MFMPLGPSGSSIRHRREICNGARARGRTGRVEIGRRGACQGPRGDCGQGSCVSEGDDRRARFERRMGAVGTCRCRRLRRCVVGASGGMRGARRGVRFERDGVPDALGCRGDDRGRRRRPRRRGSAVDGRGRAARHARVQRARHGCALLRARAPSRPRERRRAGVRPQELRHVRGRGRRVRAARPGRGGGDRRRVPAAPRPGGCPFHRGVERARHGRQLEHRHGARGCRARRERAGRRPGDRHGARLRHGGAVLPGRGSPR